MIIKETNHRTFSKLSSDMLVLNGLSIRAIAENARSIDVCVGGTECTIDANL